MPIEKGERFSTDNVYVDYEFEQVMFRWDCHSKKVYRKFYGEQEGACTIEHSNRLFNDALLYGNEITELEYKRGKPKDQSLLNDV